jgi:hypothetical protein
VPCSIHLTRHAGRARCGENGARRLWLTQTAAAACLAGTPGVCSQHPQPPAGNNQQAPASQGWSRTGTRLHECNAVTIKQAPAQGREQIVNITQPMWGSRLNCCCPQHRLQTAAAELEPAPLCANFSNRATIVVCWAQLLVGCHLKNQRQASCRRGCIPGRVWEGRGTAHLLCGFLEHCSSYTTTSCLLVAVNRVCCWRTTPLPKPTAAAAAGSVAAYVSRP